MATVTDASANSARPPPSTGAVDIVRLLGAMVIEAARDPRQFSVAAVFRAWARRTSIRLASQDIIVNFAVKKLLLVGSRELSRYILAQYPSREGFSTGSLKRSAMAFLAARALTISDDDEWRRRRAFNEAVLQPGRPHELAPDFVCYTLNAFAAPVASVEELRAAMGRTMLAVAFGGNAPPRLTQDVQRLFGLVQHPLKRVLTAPWAYWRRASFYERLRALWSARGGAKPSLLGIAGRSAAELDGAELIQQVPHWMFTFPGSGTDLMTRTLALISCTAAVRARVLAEVQAAGPIDDASTFTRLPLLEACLVETAHLYPPVTRTFHCALAGATVGNVRIPPGTEIMQLFPLFTGEDLDGNTPARCFNPDRWMGSEPVSSFDPFLGGARQCPGKSIILLVCKVALASLLVKHRLRVDAPQLSGPTLPAEFPRRGLHFHAA